MSKVLLDNLDLWTSTVRHKSTAGRGSNSKIELAGIKKLRELILELAVRGKLVPQDPNDEPASELLKRIEAEKAELIKAGKLKKQKPLPDISDDEKPFELPKGWEWVRLGDILEVINGRAYKKNEMLESGTPILRVGNLFTSNEWYYSNLELEPEKYIDNGDLIYAWSASFGPFIWSGEKVIYHYHIWKLDIFDESSSTKNFLYLYLKSITESIKASGNGIAMLHMTKERMEKLIFPLPPCEEQTRLTKRVNDLMALCDQLEQQSEQQLNAHQQLVETLLATLTNAENADELNQQWQRLAQHFDLLFSGPMGAWAIDRLKETILQLAVMGKLVPQDPTDEPASELLKRIEAEKAELIKAGKLKKQKPLPEISEDEKPFELPKGWEWISLGNIIRFMDSGWSPACETLASSDENIWGVLKTTAVQRMFFLENENKKLPISKEPKPEYEVKTGNILITRAGPTNRVGIACFVKSTRKKLMISDKIIRFQLYEKFVDGEFISLCMNTGATAEYIAKEKSGMAESQMNISQGKLLLSPIPLPPYSIQKKIVKTTNDLFSLCDQLKEKLNLASQTQLQLVDAVVAQALA